MLVAQALSLSLYAVSLIVLDKFFDRQFVLSWVFLTKVVSITLLSCAPLYVLKLLRRKFSPRKPFKIYNQKLIVLISASYYKVNFSHFYNDHII